MCSSDSQTADASNDMSTCTRNKALGLQRRDITTGPMPNTHPSVGQGNPSPNLPLLC